MTNQNALNPIISDLVTSANNLNIKTGLNLTPLVIPPFIDAQLYADLPNNNAINPVINQIVQFVNQIVNYAKPDITQLAHHLNITPQQLNKVFSNPLNSTGNHPNPNPNPKAIQDKIKSTLYAPSNLQGTVNGLEVDLSWTSNSSNQIGYHVYRSTDNINFSIIASPTGTTYNDTGLSAGTYYYKVSAYNAQGESSVSNEISILVATTLASPTNLSVTTGKTGDYWTPKFNWTDNTTGETSFIIQVSTDGVSFSDFATGIPANATTYASHTNLTDSIDYYFKIKAVKNTVSSPYSNVVRYKYPSVIPESPTGLSLVQTVGSSTYSELLTWTDNSTYEKGFIIYRSTGVESAFSPVAYVGANTTTYTDTISYNGVYSYKVVSYNDGGLSTYSNIVSTMITGLSENPDIILSTSPYTWTESGTTYYGFHVTPNKGTLHTSQDGGIGYSVFKYISNPPYGYDSHGLIIQSVAYPDNGYLMVASPYSWNPGFPIIVIVYVDYNGITTGVESEPFLLA